MNLGILARTFDLAIGSRCSFLTKRTKSKQTIVRFSRKEDEIQSLLVEFRPTEAAIAQPLKEGSRAVVLSEFPNARLKIQPPYAEDRTHDLGGRAAGAIPLPRPIS